MKPRNRNPHIPSCGKYLHAECRVEDCNCMCHTADDYGIDIYDLVGMNDYDEFYDEG